MENRNEQKMNISESEREAFVLLRAKTLNGEEKKAIWKELEKSIQQSAEAGIVKKEPLLAGLQSLFLNRSFALSAFSIVLVVGSGLSVARAAENALPGQALYSVKINVNEPIVGSFKYSPGAKIGWERELAGRRIAEAETLAEEGKLGEVEKIEIEQQLSQNRRDIEAIEGHDVTDDEFFPQQIKGETEKINVRVDHGRSENFVHIEERLETESDERREAENGIVDVEDHDTSFGGYTKQGTKIKNEKKTETKSDVKSSSDKQSSKEEKSQKESDQKDSSSEKNNSSEKQGTEQKNPEQKN